MKIFIFTLLVWSYFFKMHTSYDNETAEIAFDNALSSQYDQVIPVYQKNILEEIKEKNKQHALIESSICNMLTETLDFNEIIEVLKLINEKNITQNNLLKLITSIFQKQEIVLSALHYHIIGTLSLDDALVESAKIITKILKNHEIISSEKYLTTCIFQVINFIANEDCIKTIRLLKAHHYLSLSPDHIAVNGCMATIDKTTYIDPLDISYYCIMSDLKDWWHNWFNRNNKI